jgi:hypothetical protein
LAAWAADCAERVLPLYVRRHPDDSRPARAIEGARAWARGEITVGAARAAAVEAHAAAREAADEAACAAARAAGHAVATAHMADHALGPVYYGAKAVKAASSDAEANDQSRLEHEWQRTRLPEEIRELVSSAIEDGSVLGAWQP